MSGLRNCKQLDADVLKTFTDRRELDYNVQDAQGRTPLHWMTIRRRNNDVDVSAIKLMLSRGADPRLLDNDRLNFIEFALKHGVSDTDISKILEDLHLKEGDFLLTLINGQGKAAQPATDSVLLANLLAILVNDYQLDPNLHVADSKPLLRALIDVEKDGDGEKCNFDILEAVSKRWTSI